MRVVRLDLDDVRARHVLAGAQAGHPRVEVGERALKRDHLAYVAAQQPQGLLFIEEVETVLACHRLDVGCVGEHHLDVDVVAPTNLVDKVVRFLGQPPGVQREDADLRVDPVGQVDDDHVLGEERGRDGHPRMELLETPGQNVLCRRRVQPFDLVRRDSHQAVLPPICLVRATPGAG